MECCSSELTCLRETLEFIREDVVLQVLAASVARMGLEDFFTLADDCFSVGFERIAGVHDDGRECLCR